MPQYSIAERTEKTEQAVELRARQWTFNRIAQEIGVSPHTSKKWVEDELARRAEHRGIDKESHLAVYNAIQKEAWEAYEHSTIVAYTPEGKMLKFPHPQAIGYLNTIKSAEDSKVKITGAEAPIKHEHKDTTEYEVTWDEIAADSLEAVTP